jgi:hypothetical protein
MSETGPGRGVVAVTLPREVPWLPWQKLGSSGKHKEMRAGAGGHSEMGIAFIIQSGNSEGLRWRCGAQWPGRIVWTPQEASYRKHRRHVRGKSCKSVVSTAARESMTQKIAVKTIKKNNNW